MSKFTKKEKDFATKLGAYENQWVAIRQSSNGEEIVASGKTATEVQKNLGKKTRDVFFTKVPSSKAVLIA